MDCGDTKIDNFDAELNNRTKTLLRQDALGKDYEGADMKVFLDSYGNGLEEYMAGKNTLKA
jgi:hypothetical protein